MPQPCARGGACSFEHRQIPQQTKRVQRAVVTHGLPLAPPSCADALRGASTPHGNVAADRSPSVTNNEIERRVATQWLVYATGLPLIRRRCLRCASPAYRADGTFRVNANGKLLDVWLLARCLGCGKTVNLTVLERVHVRAIDPLTLTRFHDNDIELAAKLLEDPVLLRRNGITLDWDGAWGLQQTPADVAEAEVIDTSVRFAQRIPIRVTTLLSVGLNVSRSEVRRLIAAGNLSSPHRLTGTPSGDFSFTLHRQANKQGGH
jgi:hypothetical protein